AQGIAKINADIQTGLARTGGQPPNDLLDQRDRLLDELAQKVAVNAVKQDGGAVNVFIGNGQPLVLGSIANELSTVQDAFDPTRLGISMRTQGGAIDITRNVTGGALGGLLDFRREQLDPAHNALGRISVALATVVNGQHVQGIDLSGDPGGAFFAMGGAETLPGSSNQGTGSVSTTIADVEGLTQRDYILELTGSGWQLRYADTGATVPMAGDGSAATPFTADGLEIEVSGAAQVGDEFLIRPTRAAVSDLQVLITDPSEVAAAAPIRTSVNPDNTGTGAISAGEIASFADFTIGPDVTIEIT